MIDEVLNQLRNAGLLIEGPLVFGKLTHVPVEGGKRSKKQGWYVLYEMRLQNGDTTIAGAYGNYKTDYKDKIERNTRHWSESDRQEYKIRMEAARAAKAEAEKVLRDQCAARAARAWANLPDSGASPYLQRKKVAAFGLRFARGSIVVPVRTVEGNLVGLQWISADGEKKFMTGTPKKGAFHFIGTYDPAKARVIALAEGYATGATVHMATGWPVAVAFDAGNLLPVATALRALYPDASFIICGDDDSAAPGWGCMDCGHFLTDKQKAYTEFAQCPNCSSRRCQATNTGRVKALIAARRVSGVAAFPVFEPMAVAA